MRTVGVKQSVVKQLSVAERAQWLRDLADEVERSVEVGVNTVGIVVIMDQDTKAMGTTTSCLTITHTDDKTNCELVGTLSMAHHISLHASLPVLN